MMISSFKNINLNDFENFSHLHFQFASKISLLLHILETKHSMHTYQMEERIPSHQNNNNLKEVLTH